MKITKLFLSVLVISFVSLLVPQAVNAQTTNNPYGISNAQWNSYANKTNILLESVDEGSFLNYVIVSSGANLNDKRYFTGYIKGKLRSDREELIKRVGQGSIKTVVDVKAYLSSLQPKYKEYFAEYKKRKTEIVQAQDMADVAKAVRSGITPTPANCGSACSNPGFESGTGFWDYSSGYACTSPDPCGLTPSFSSTAHILEAVGGFDPIVGAALPHVAPGGGAASLMIGNGSTTGSGHNDTFHPILAIGLTSFEATVYDRWGLKMYEWTDENGGWNGQAKNGSPAPDGTYYYIINGKGADNKDYMYTGFIQLLREK